MKRRVKQFRFPGRTLLESGEIPIAELAAMAIREGQSTNPLFRVHRWFARRLSVQFRSLLAGIALDAEGEGAFWDSFYGNIDLSGAVILDPFVGGGTSLVEAASCGAEVIGYDIDPVASAITRFELDLRSFDDLPPAVGKVADSVSEQMREFHLTRTSSGDEVEVLHHFWVERRRCEGCDETFDLHPHHQLAYDAAKELQWVFCRSCEATQELPIDRTQLRCGCGTRTTIRSGVLSAGKPTCPSCGFVEDLSARGRRTGQPPEWRLFAQEYIERGGRNVVRQFKAAGEVDRTRYSESARRLQRVESRYGAFAPSRSIPEEGRSDGRPLIHGFRRYTDLFNRRQLLHLTLLGRAIASEQDERSKRLLGIAFSDHLTSNCMYAAYAFGYRRISPLFSIHSYRHITRPVELNPWLDGIGRGTFPNAMSKIRRAIHFAKSPRQMSPEVGRMPANVSADVQGRPAARATIRTGSSASLSELADESVDLILTDPPYFDNLSYSELSDFFLAWHQVLGIAAPPYDDKTRAAPIRENLAIQDRSGESVETYTRTLAAILCECRRVLRRGGLCVFTYHHRSPSAWHALGMALASSGLRATAVVPSRGEGQGGLHSYEGTIKWDAVLVCRKSGKAAAARGRPLVVAKTAVATASRKVSAYNKRLARTPKIGFREPDQLNLFRALLVSGARFGSPSDERVLLEVALRGESSARPRM